MGMKLDKNRMMRATALRWHLAEEPYPVTIMIDITHNYLRHMFFTGHFDPATSIFGDFNLCEFAKKEATYQLRDYVRMKGYRVNECEVVYPIRLEPFVPEDDNDMREGVRFFVDFMASFVADPTLRPNRKTNRG